MAKDKIDAAIAAGVPLREEQRVRLEVRVASGRRVLVDCPADLTDTELLSLVYEVASGVRNELHRHMAEAAKGTIVVVRSMPPARA